MNDAQRARLGTAAVFFICGIGHGTWAPRLAELKDQVGASDGQLGLALLMIGLGALIAVVLVIFWAFGLLTRTALWLGGLAIPLYLLAIGLGARYYGREGNRYYRTAALLVLAAIALATLVTALTTG